MKEFVKTKKVTYNLMSFTAFKALVLFSELVNGSKSYKEICDIFYNHPYLREEISMDTFRVYMNSLKRIGCQIKRFKGKNKESRYIIQAHPFELNYSPEQLQSALKVLKSLVKNMDIEELLDMDEFLEKIGTYIKNTEFIDEVKQISYLKDIDKDILRELLQCCKDKNQIIVTYNSPNSGDKKMEILADKIDIINGKVYLCGINFEYKQDGIFLINRIKNIEEIKTETTMPKGIKETKVVYEVVNNPNYELESFEKVLEKDDKKLVIEATTTNNFLLRQRLLALGPNCTIISPEEFKTKFVELLKDMKAGYYCG